MGLLRQMLTQLSAGIIVFVIRQDSSSGQVCKGGRTDSTREIRCRVTCPDQLLLEEPPFDSSMLIKLLREERGRSQRSLWMPTTHASTQCMCVCKDTWGHMGLAASG